MKHQKRAQFYNDAIKGRGHMNFNLKYAFQLKHHDQAKQASILVTLNVKMK